MKKLLKHYFNILIIITIGVLIALAGSQGEENNYYGSIPPLVFCMIISFAIHWLIFIPSYIAKSEKFYDITGTLAYISTIVVASSHIVLNLGSNLTDRSILLIIFVSIWSLRLGTFLFSRIIKAGEDKRFRDIKISFSSFLVAWTLSGLWVFLTSANALTAIINNQPLSGNLVSYFGIGLWLSGFLIEVVADLQKKRFRADPRNQGEFISHGLWNFSRHPNYFGEIILWFGIAFIALPILSGWQFATLISPLFVFLLLTRISGINLLETKADEIWGQRKDYNDYKNNTPVLFPFIKKVKKS
jgi:steroid 5-alpha reductase family enzyme